MEKEFVPCEQALDLKELGFNENCIKVYHTDKDNNFNINENFNISAPLYQQAFRWFRKKYNHLKIRIGEEDFREDIFEYDIKNIITVSGFKTYEEAELECLKKLIEIVKDGKNR